MSLDLFTSDIDNAVNYAARVSAPELPSTFADNFADAWNRGYLTSQSISGETRKITARSRMVDDAIAKTGDQSFAALSGAEGGGFDMDAFNAKVAKHRADKPDLDLPTMTPESIQQRADDIGVAQLSESKNFANRERTTGGAIGSFVGSAAASLTDPVNVVAFPLAAPQSLGVLGTALAWSAIGGGSQAVIEALNMPSMERIQPGYSTSGEPVQNILEASAGAGALGGVLKGLANAWTRYKTGAWPRSIRDAGNVVESEAQIAATNPMPGVEGEAAHRTALQKAIDDLASGQPVDVEGIIPPEQVKYIEAWHGSPHDFDRFDISKIGTGEGAQAYGHGLYFAENQGVARSYQLMGDATINGRPFDMNNPVHKAVSMIDEFGSREAAIRESVGRIAHDPGDFYGDVLNHLESGRALPELDTAGKMYKVRITADKEQMLDLDQPLNQQTLQVQEAVKRAMGIDYHGNFDAAKSARLWQEFQGADGKTAVRQGFIASDDRLVAQRLADAGIPGLKYFDEGSRPARSLADTQQSIDYYRSILKNEPENKFAAEQLKIYEDDLSKAETGTRNFVVFNDKHVEITHKNGKPVNAEIRQDVVDQAMGLPPRQKEMPLEQPVPPAAELNTPTVNALKDEVTPAKVEEARTSPDLAETVNRDLDKLVLEHPDLEVPTGVTIDADGRTVPTTRKVESVIEEADSRLAAAKEIEACVGPYPAEAAE